MRIIKKRKIKDRPSFSDAQETPHVLVEGECPYNKTKQCFIIEAGLCGHVTSLVGSKAHAKEDQGKELFFPEVQFEKFVIRDSYKSNKPIKVKDTNTYGKTEKFYSYEEAVQWMFKYMKERRKEAEKAFFFRMNKFPWLMWEAFENDKGFKPKMDLKEYKHMLDRKPSRRMVECSKQKKIKLIKR